MMQTAKRTIAGAALAALMCAAAVAAEPAWPQWRGPNRDGKSPDTGLLKTWPRGGPKLIWTATGIGSGFSTLTMQDGLMYTTGIIGRQLKITALDMDGKQKWQVTHGPGWTGSHPGSRAVPTIDGDSIYLLSGRGDLRQYNRTTGAPGWTVSLVKNFGGRTPRWGYAESVLIDGEKLICTPGGSNVMVALNKTTGKTIWKSTGFSAPAGYASAIAFEVGGIRQYANLTAKALCAFEADTGKFLWRYTRPAGRVANCPDPIFQDDRVFCASGYRVGGGLVKLDVAGKNVTATEVWDTRHMVNHHGGYVIVDGAIYGYSDSDRGWTCLDFKTGKMNWKGGGVGKGSILYADGMLYCYGEGGGNIALVKATPEKYEEAGRFKVPSGGGGPYWAHPVVCGGRMYLRHADHLYAYDVKAK